MEMETLRINIKISKEEKTVKYLKKINCLRSSKQNFSINIEQNVCLSSLKNNYFGWLKIRFLMINIIFPE